MSTDWKSSFRRPAFQAGFVLAFVATVMMWVYASEVVRFAESRPGALIDDPILRKFESVALNVTTFFLIYAAAGLGAWEILKMPRRFVIGVLGYAFLVSCRMTSILLLPLDPPAGILPLADPLIEAFSKQGAPLTRDLFFSGHVSTTFMCWIVSRTAWVKHICMAATIGVAACVMAQKVHYAIDVFAAPFFAFGCYHFSKGLLKTLFPREPWEQQD
jgi:hypothetical protein